MTETRQLLSRYAEGGSESAFRELVEAYIDLVYSTAIRLVEGDSHRAEDVTQMVFVRLTQKARTLAGDVSLGGWLHRDTCYVAATLMRSERRRQVRERQAVEMNALDDNTYLEFVMPVLDDAINQLPDQDREAIILRFFEQQNFRALAAVIGGSEDAARMRVNRALEKLHGLLKNRGVALSLAGLATILGAKAVAAAPIGLAASVASGASAGGTIGGAGTVARTVSKGWKFALLPVAALLFIAAVGIYRSNRSAQKSATSPSLKIAAATTPPPIAPTPAPAAEPVIPGASAFAPTGMRFQALETGSERPIVGAKLHLAYFGNDGAGKGAELETSADGSVQVDFPQPLYTGLNLFVSVQGHVPLVTSFRNDDMPTNYVMNLAVGTVVGGTILDEAKNPVANANIQFYEPMGMDRAKKENVDFYSCDQKTDADGHWSSDMMPPNFDRIGILVTHPDFAILLTDLPVNTASAADSALVMKPGTLIAGIVTDNTGQPIAGAKIQEIQNRREPKKSAATDASGRFELKHMNPGDLELAVQAPGFAPVARDTVVSNEPSELKFALESGRIFRGHIIGDNGAPISNAVVKTDWDNQGLRRFEWSSRTDEQGKFEWTAAPAQSVSYWFEAPGFSAIRDQSLKADGTDHEITLTRLQQPAIPRTAAVKIIGSVLDDETGQPLEDFKVMIADRVIPDFPPDFSYGTDGKDGAFELHAQPMTGAYQIQIQKDGYAPIASTNLLVKDGPLTLAFRLHKDAGINGTVVLPTGETVLGATVFLYELQGSVYMDQPARFRKEVSPKQNMKTDKTGRFSFPATLQARGLIVVHDQGYADVPLTNFNGKIVLQPWGRVEGKLLVKGQPVAGQKISLENLQPTHIGASPKDRHFAALSLWLEATTGADGSFVFEKVPPGERKITQRVARTATGPGRLYDTQGKPIHVTPGAVTYVELGGHGQTISGRAAFAGATESPIAWDQVAVQVVLKVPGVADSRPRRESFNSQEAFFAAMKSYSETADAYWASDAGHQADLAQRTYAAYCTDDGSFTIPDVPAGEYSLRITIREHTPKAMTDFDARELGTLDMDLVVPDPSGKEHPTMDLGTVQVPAAKPGEVSGL